MRTELISGDLTLTAIWNDFVTADYVILETQLQNPSAFTEINGIPQDANAYHAMKMVCNDGWQKFDDY